MSQQSNPATLREAPVTGIERMAVNLTKAWARYVALFTVPPHGTEKQMAALIELCPQLKEAIRLLEKQREERNDGMNDDEKQREQFDAERYFEGTEIAERHNNALAQEVIPVDIPEGRRKKAPPAAHRKL